MFFESQPTSQKDCYEKFLKIVGSLSRLSSDSDIPFLYYRTAENVFCKTFGAENLARSDISLDARKDDIGLGLKTFINKSSGSMEKIAEFNKNRGLIPEKFDASTIKLIAGLRNERLRTTAGITDISLEKMYYHCVLREKDKFIIHENNMQLINIDNIGSIKKTSNNVVSFTDGNYEYSFNFSKSTLYKRFISNSIHEIDINILSDPYGMLEKLFDSSGFNEIKNIVDTSINKIQHKICLPLYSTKPKTVELVSPKSGLNQWNAGGRTRDYNEVYIPIPSVIRKYYPDFFPQRDTSFTLKLPNGSDLMVKICQDDGKALMSDPNSSLGKWLLRDVLELEEGELLTYKKLERIGIDSVEIIKFTDNTFEINFKQLGSFKKFEEQTLSKHQKLINKY